MSKVRYVDPVKAYMAAIGRRGGKANTPAQQAQRRANPGRPKGSKNKKP